MSYSLNRRHAIRIGSTACLSGWLGPLATTLAAEPSRHRSCILLWMNGGPSTIDMWDLKPGNPNGGPLKDGDKRSGSPH